MRSKATTTLCFPLFKCTPTIMTFARIYWALICKLWPYTENRATCGV